MTYAGKYTVEGSKEDFDEFNELLLIGYNEKSHMDVSGAHSIPPQSLLIYIVS